MSAITSQLDPRSQEFLDNVAYHRDLVAELDRRLARAADGGGSSAIGSGAESADRITDVPAQHIAEGSGSYVPAPVSFVSPDDDEEDDEDAAQPGFGAGARNPLGGCAEAAGDFRRVARRQSRQHERAGRHEQHEQERRAEAPQQVSEHRDGIRPRR